MTPQIDAWLRTIGKKPATTSIDGKSGGKLCCLEIPVNASNTIRLQAARSDGVALRMVISVLITSSRISGKTRCWKISRGLTRGQLLKGHRELAGGLSYVIPYPIG